MLDQKSDDIILTSPEDSSNEENLKKVLKAFADRIPQSSTGSSDSGSQV